MDASTLSYMQTYWKTDSGTDESFWEHEWGKHGTCISTLAPGCYQGYETGEEAVDFFNKVVSLFKTLPTYQWLAEAGITPSASKTYSTDAIQAALTKQHGNPVTLGCESGALNQVYYHYNVQGSLQDGTFVSAAPDGSKSTCTGNIQYKPKSNSSSNARAHRSFKGHSRVFTFDP